MGGLARAGRAGPPAAGQGVHLHARALALSLRLPDPPGDDGRGDRGLRGGVGVLRRCVRGADPGSHQSDRRQLRCAGPEAGRRLPRLQPGSRLPRRPDPREACAGQGPRRAKRPACPRRLLRRRASGLARAGTRARAAVVPDGRWSAPSLAHAAPSARALRGGRATGAAARTDRALRRAAVVRSEGGARSVRAGGEGALFAAARVGRPQAACSRRQPDRAVLRSRRSGQDPSSPASGRPSDRRRRLPRAPARLRPSRHRVLRAPSRRARTGDGPLRPRAARRAAAVDPHAARVRAAELGQEIRLRARRARLQPGAGGRDDRRRAPAPHPRARSRAARAPAVHSFHGCPSRSLPASRPALRAGGTQRRYR